MLYIRRRNWLPATTEFRAAAVGDRGDWTPEHGRVASWRKPRGHIPMTRHTAGHDRTATAGSTGILRAGTAAPDFELRATPDQSLRLSDLRNRPVVLAFYPADLEPRLW